MRSLGQDSGPPWPRPQPRHYLWKLIQTQALFVTAVCIAAMTVSWEANLMVEARVGAVLLATAQSHSIYLIHERRKQRLCKSLDPNVS